jgi:hypothetical protein
MPKQDDVKKIGDKYYKYQITSIGQGQGEGGEPYTTEEWVEIPKTEAIKSEQGRKVAEIKPVSKPTYRIPSPVSVQPFSAAGAAPGQVPGTDRTRSIEALKRVLDAASRTNVASVPDYQYNTMTPPAPDSRRALWERAIERRNMRGASMPSQILGRI